MDGAEYKGMLARIDNWRAAYKIGMRFGSCGSAEGRYRATADQDASHGLVVNRADAELIELAWRSMMPVRSKWLIKWHFVQGVPDAAIIRMLQRKHGYGVRRDYFACEIRCAVEQLKKNVDRLESRAYSRLTQFNSGSSVSWSPVGGLVSPEANEPALA